MDLGFSQKNKMLEQARGALAQCLEAHPSGSLAALPVDPWVAASGLQKGIRRGDAAVALGCAATLLRARPDRLWRRLVVIAIEDVGIADLELAREVVAVSGQKAWRREQGGDERIARHVIERLCWSAKERSCDDLIAIADLDPYFRRERCELAFAEADELCRLVADGSQPLGLRGLAAWYRAGTERMPGRQLVPRRGRPEDLFSLYRTLGVSDELLWLCEAALGKSRTALPIMLPLIWLERKEALRVVECSLPEAPSVRGVPAFAFDGFSRIGRSALSRFLATCSPVRDFIAAHAPDADPSAVVAMLVFHAEGGLVDRRLIWAGSEAITRRGALADIVGRGLPTECAEEGLMLLREHMPRLHEARNAVAAQAQLHSPAEPTLL
jgi:hypothetical protein